MAEQATPSMAPGMKSPAGSLPREARPRMRQVQVQRQPAGRLVVAGKLDAIAAAGRPASVAPASPMNSSSESKSRRYSDSEVAGRRWRRCASRLPGRASALEVGLLAPPYKPRCHCTTDFDSGLLVHRRRGRVYNTAMASSFPATRKAASCRWMDLAYARTARRPAASIPGSYLLYD